MSAPLAKHVWTIDEAWAGKGACVINAEEQCIAFFPEHSVGNGHTDHARLASAAPDLLAALQALDEFGHTQMVWDQAKRAMAKAAGGAA